MKEEKRESYEGRSRWVSEERRKEAEEGSKEFGGLGKVEVFKAGTGTGGERMEVEGRNEVEYFGGLEGVGGGQGNEWER